jgi:hypothetical protein
LEWAPPLDEMTVSDKLHAMEQIWDDLCRNPENVPSPGWHSYILQAREGRVKEGSSKFTDWAEAKEKIRNSVK